MDGFEGKRWITPLAYLKIKGKHSSNGPTAALIYIYIYSFQFSDVVPVASIPRGMQH